ncbi:PQQ-dependent sugar dehydrogenase [Rhodoferax sp.]|uniref:PQQ-dependent sugar dehydrogenase n=1 Tax=Rhodoferax sp. TaxID=50421 RepID=UPI00277ACB1E|nr:sorbosone dehydrogenase family protein [Rhodoferax sp.]
MHAKPCSAAKPAYPLFGVAALAAALGAVTACGDLATLPVSAGMGPRPSLPAPQTTLVPTVNIAPAIGWPPGALPQPAPGTRVAAFARDLDHPRWLYVLPNGDVLVAETNAPPKPDGAKGLKAWLTGLVMKRAGAAVPSANRITLLRDTDGDGVADLRTALRFPYAAGDTRITVQGTQLVALPGGPINHHWTKNLIASPDGSRLYVTVGSNSNVAERGMAVEAQRAAIWEVDTRTGAHRVFASGLRNPVGLAWESRSGAFYGWPYSYYDQHVDQRVTPQRPELVARAVAPDYALGEHTASLGLAWSVGNALPAVFAKGMFVGQHGSWNRRPHSGYKVIFVPFDGVKPADVAPVDVLTGFLNQQGEAMGRPVGVALDKQGALLVADDVGNVVWRVSAQR